MLFLRLFIDKPNVELFFHFASGQEADIPTCTPPNSPPTVYSWQSQPQPIVSMKKSMMSLLKGLLRSYMVNI